MAGTLTLPFSQMPSLLEPKINYKLNTGISSPFEILDLSPPHHIICESHVTHHPLTYTNLWKKI